MVRPKKPVDDGAATPAVVAPASNEIAPPAAGTMQSEQDGAGEADSGIPAVIEPAAPTFDDGAPVTDFAPADPAPAAWRLGFPVLMHLHLDGEAFEPGEFAFVTEDEFDQLQRGQVFSPGLDWEDGALPQETGDGEG